MEFWHIFFDPTSSPTVLKLHHAIFNCFLCFHILITQHITPIKMNENSNTVVQCGILCCSVDLCATL